jgi:hypothetical protein
MLGKPEMLNNLISIMSSARSSNRPLVTEDFTNRRQEGTGRDRERLDRSIWRERTMAH